MNLCRVTTEPHPILGCTPARLLRATGSPTAWNNNHGRIIAAVLLVAFSAVLPAEPDITFTELWHWGPVANSHPELTDIWSAPASARIFDTNDDGFVNEEDDPSLIFISGNSMPTVCQDSGTSPTACHTGILRALNGRTGDEQYSLDKVSENSSGFAGISVAVGDILGNGTIQIVAVTGEGDLVLIGSNNSPPLMESMQLLRTSDTPLPDASSASFGSGGALALGDMDADSSLEIAYGSSVYDTTDEAIELRFIGTSGIGGTSSANAISAFAELNGSSGIELVSGRTAYAADGSILWDRSDLQDGFVAVADINGNGGAEVVLISGGSANVLDGASGSTLLGPKALAGTGSGGPPVLADFDGDNLLEIGVAMAGQYSVLDPNFGTSMLDLLWQKQTHDLSSSQTGSTAFDFDDDGQDEVIEADQCFLWVFDGATGGVRLALPHTSTTSNEMPITTDIDGDGRAELVMISNGADPEFWRCINGDLEPVTVNGITWVSSGVGSGAYRGVSVLNAASGEWPDALTLWNQHTFRTNSDSFRLGGIEVLIYSDGYEQREP